MLASTLLFSVCANALTLPDLLRAASDSHPTIQAARQNVNAANEDLNVAQRQYWPTFSASVESGTRNTTEIPARLLRAEQTLWDFGRTKANVGYSERSVDVASAALAAQRQAIGLQVIDAWRTLQSSHGRIRVSQDMLKHLGQHESMMLRRVAGELSTQIDLDLVRSRILQARVELTQAQTSGQVAITRLQNLTGLQNLQSVLADMPPLPSRADLDAQFQALGRLDWDAAANRQPAVLRAVEEMRAGNERIAAKTAESHPQIYARLDQYLDGRRETGAYLGVRYTPGAGFSTWIEAKALAARALALEETVQAARIEARQTLDLDRDDLRDNGVRAKALDLAVQGAQRVFESYERQFPAGRKTWIDLMNAIRELAQNAYTLVDAHAAQAGALYRLQLRMDPEMIGASSMPLPLTDGTDERLVPASITTAPLSSPLMADKP